MAWQRQQARRNRGGANDPITVKTGPAVPTSGVYYLNASLTITIAQGDVAMCGLSPFSGEPTGGTIGPAPAGELVQIGGLDPAKNGRSGLRHAAAPPVIPGARSVRRAARRGGVRRLRPG